MDKIYFSGLDYSSRFSSALLGDKKNNGVDLDFKLVFTEKKDKDRLGYIYCGDDFIGVDKEMNIGIFDNHAILEAVGKTFSQVDVIVISGHHYGSNYYANENNNHYAPGLTTALEHRKKDGVKYTVSTAFDLNYFSEGNYTFPNVKLIIMVGCNYLRPNALHLYKKYFPNAIALGYHAQAPLGTDDNLLLEKFFQLVDWTKIDDKPAVAKVWKAAINASHNQSSQPGWYYKDESGKWIGKYIRAAAINDSAKYKFKDIEEAEESPEIRIKHYLLEM